MTLNLTGQQFGMLTALEPMGSIKGRSYWAVECECGATELVQTSSLRSGNTQSCGCKRAQTQTIHGGTVGGKRTPENAAWSNLRRLRKPMVKEWENYQQFFKDVGWRPTPEHELRRRDIREPHGPNNTYWRNPIEQQRLRQLTQQDLGDEFFLDMRRTKPRAVETIEEREGAERCLLRT